MSLFRRRHCQRRVSYTRRGYQGRFNFGRAKLDRVQTAGRENTLIEMIGRDAYDTLSDASELNRDVLHDTGFLTIVDALLYCGSHLQLALLEYIDAQGHMASRHIEYYSFRRTQSSNILVYGWSYRDPPGALRSYRLDRILTCVPSLIPYEPKWDVELIV